MQSTTAAMEAKIARSAIFNSAIFKLPHRILASIFEFCNSSKELATSETVCKSWKLDESLKDRLWKQRYGTDWEEWTGEHPGIAPEAKTPWIVRYKRRKQTEENWCTGNYREFTLTKNFVGSFAVYESMAFIYTLQEMVLIHLAPATGHKQVASFQLHSQPTELALSKTRAAVAFMDPQEKSDSVAVLQLPDLRLIYQIQLPVTAFLLGLAAHENIVLVGTSNALLIYHLSEDYKSHKLLTVHDSAGRRQPQADWTNDLVYSLTMQTFYATRISTGKDLYYVDLLAGAYSIALDAKFKFAFATYGIGGVQRLDIRTKRQARYDPAKPNNIATFVDLAGRDWLTIWDGHILSKIQMLNRHTFQPVGNIELPNVGLLGGNIQTNALFLVLFADRKVGMRLLDFTP